MACPLLSVTKRSLQKFRSSYSLCNRSVSITWIIFLLQLHMLVLPTHGRLWNTTQTISPIFSIEPIQFKAVKVLDVVSNCTWSVALSTRNCIITLLCVASFFISFNFNGECYLHFLIRIWLDNHFKSGKPTIKVLLKLVNQ